MAADKFFPLTSVICGAIKKIMSVHFPFTGLTTNQPTDRPTDRPTNHPTNKATDNAKHKISDNAYFSFQLCVFPFHFLKFHCNLS